MFIIKKSIILIGLLSIVNQIKSQVTNYNWSENTIPKSNFYEVSVKNGSQTETIFTHLSKPNGKVNPHDPAEGAGVQTQWIDRTMSYAIFAHKGATEITVKKLYGSPATRVDISPKAFGINPFFFDGTTVKFILKDNVVPGYISVNFICPENLDPDGTTTGKDIKHGMMIFADKPEVNVPSPTDPNVLVYSEETTYEQMQAANTVYFPAGDWNLLSKITDQHGNRGRYHIAKNNQTFYLAGGAFLRGSIDADGMDGFKFIGRGIITGLDYGWHEMREPKAPTGELGTTAWLNFTASDNSVFNGISAIYATDHTMPSGSNNVIKNVKIIGFAYNNDGIRPSNGSVAEEVFIKTNDDHDYARDRHIVKNSVFWPSKNGATGQLGWNNLGAGKATYENWYVINAEWASYSRNRGIIGCRLTQGSALGNDTLRNIYGEDNTSLLANMVITYDPARVFDTSKPGEVKDFLFKNIIFENTFKANNGSIIKQPIKGFVHTVGGVNYKATINNIRFTNLIIGNVLVTQANHATYFDIDPNTTSNIIFDTEGTLHNVVATAGANGKMSPSGTLLTPEGMTRVVNIIPNAGYKIESVTVDGVNVGRQQHVSFKNVTEPHKVSATFVASPNDYYNLGAPLPLKLLSFSAKIASQNKVSLNWQFDNANDMSETILEKSRDGSNFEAIYRTKEKNTKFAFEDSKMLQGDSYYRLKITENDNKFYYSKIINVFLENNILKIEPSSDEKAITVFPNPAHSYVNIKSEKGINKVGLFDLMGKKISNIYSKNNHTYMLPSLKSGVYLLKIQTKKGGTYSEKLTIN
ncbi:MAG: T9SS type A sorting domain-containing protein [Pseudarcicella sp.]|nr:T9SS type A sorting domain-containing protein [Pseudarcicella sp.]